MNAPAEITTILRSGEVFREDARGNVRELPPCRPIGEMHAVTGADFSRSMAWGAQTPNAVRGAITSGLATAGTSPVAVVASGESREGNERGRQPGNSLPHAAGSATSAAAADSMTTHAQKQAQEVLSLIRAAGSVGRICDEVEQELNMSHQSTSARINDLVKSGALVRTDRQRPTRSGRKADVIIAAGVSEELPL